MEDLKIQIDPNLKSDFLIQGEEGLKQLCQMVRRSWEQGEDLIITAEKVIFKKEE